MTSPVEMPKGRAALPATVVAGTAFFITLGGQRPMTSPVEMTKGRAALPATVVAGEAFFITLGGPTAHDFSGRDDKGEGGAASDSSCWNSVFHHLGRANGP